MPKAGHDLLLFLLSLYAPVEVRDSSPFVPPVHVVQQALLDSHRLLTWLQARQGIMGRSCDCYDPTIQETYQLRRWWKLMEEYWQQHQMNPDTELPADILERARQLVGDERWYSCDWPPAVPVWRLPTP